MIYYKERVWNKMIRELSTSEVRKQILRINEAISTLNAFPQLHTRSCYEDISGRLIPFECNCPTRDVVDKLNLVKDLLEDEIQGKIKEER